MNPLLCAAVGLTLLPAVTARRSGGGGGESSGDGDGGEDGSTFDTPPLAVATIVVCSLLILATIVLFGVSRRALFKKGVRLPSAGFLLALIVGATTNALDVAFIAVGYTTNDAGLHPLSIMAFLHLEFASFFFNNFIYVAIYIAIALVLRDRYLSVHPSSPGLTWFTCMAVFLPIMMIVFFAADEGFEEATSEGLLNFTISQFQFESRATMAENLFSVAVAFKALGAVFLAISAFIVKARTEDDRVMTLTVFVIIPLLSLYAIAQLIIEVLEVVMHTCNTCASLALSFSLALIRGVLHIAILSVLVFLIRRPHLWTAQPLPMQSAPPTNGTPLTQGAPLLQGKPLTQDASAPQFLVMGAPPDQGTTPTGGATSPQIFVHSTPPGVQFPGQWGHIQQQQGLQTGPLQPHWQQYAYVPVYAIQTPGTSAPATNITQA